MKHYFGFMDETGALHHDPQQNIFAIGLLKCEQTSVLSEEIRILVDKINSKMALNREKQQSTRPLKKFEFKFSSITKSMHTYYCDLLNL